MKFLYNYLKKNKFDIIITFALLIIPFIFFQDTFRLDKIILGSGDPTAYNLPLQYLNLDIIRSGEFPFWNRYIFSGYPMLANPQSNIFYPITLIFGMIFSTAVAFNLSLLFHYSLAGIFMYFFLGEYDLSRISRFAASLVFMFSGPLISLRSHPFQIYTMVWLPLILLLLEKYRKNKDFRFVMAASLFYAISFFCSHQQIFLYSSMVISLYIIYYTFIYKNIKNYKFLFSFFIFIFGFIVISIQLIPNYQLLAISGRSIIDYNYFSSFSYSPKLFPALLFPFVYGNPFYQLGNVTTYYGPWNYTEMIIYFGIFSLPVFIFGFFIKNYHKYFWFFIIVFSFFLLLGNSTPIFKIMYYVPLFNEFRVPARNWFEFGFAFSVLVGFGFEYFKDADKEKIKKILIWVVTGLIVILSGFLVFYYFFKISVNKQLIGFLGISSEDLKLFLKNIDINNYSIFIPLIIMVCLIIFLSISIIKRKKYFNILFIILIFLDLFQYNFFHEKNSDTKYLVNKKENLIESRFLSNDKDPFRFFPVASNLNGILLNNNKNIHNKIETITGYEPFILKDYASLTKISESTDSNNNWRALLLNNNILSILNVKYIVVPKLEDSSDFMKGIEKVYAREGTSILDWSKKQDIEYKNLDIIQNDNLFFEKGEGSNKYIKIPVNIHNNSEYLAAFYIRKRSEMDNLIFFDFYGNGYDDPKQEFLLRPNDVQKEFILVKKIINTSDIPKDTQVYFRIFTNSKSEIEIKDLQIFEITKQNNYRIVYSNDSIMVIENKNFIPRFSFAEKIIEAEDLKIIKEKLWEKNIILESDAFDVKKNTFVEGVDFEKTIFDNKNIDFEIIDYHNNSVILTIKNYSDCFLIFSDIYFPGWKASIDGAETKIYRTNGILKGIYIPQGEHRIIFKYIPNNFILLLVVSITSTIFIIISIIFLTVKKNNSKKLKPQ